METLKNKKAIEIVSPSLFLDLSKSLLNKIDSFVNESELNERNKKELYKLFEEVYGEGFTNAMIE